MTTATKVHPAASALLGIPFRKSGRTIAGADCVGVVVLFLRATGIPVEDPWDMARAARWECEGELLLPSSRPTSGLGRWSRVPLSAPRETGDLLISPDGDHVSIYVGGGMVLETFMNHPSSLHDVRKVVRRMGAPKVWRWYR